MRQYFLKGFWFSLYSICLAPVFAQTLFTYGSKQASVKGFIRAFEKNPGEGDRRKALEEYLPLYINYVLKVQDAYDKKLDTFSAQKAELMRYKLQLAESYIADKSGGESLTDEAIERMQTEILLGHILIEYTNKDTAAAIQKAGEAIRQLRAGKSWSDVAAQYATDASIKKNKGVAGWIGPFSIPYAYENLVYNLPKGKYTEYIRASQGIHIFSKLDTRPGSGTVEVAQILLTFFPTMTAQESAQRGRLADSIYNLLKAGENFETLVGTFSEDRTSKFQQGLLQPFSTGTYDTRFEQEAFALKNPGDFSKPFQTGYGWHILKLVSRKAPPEKEDSEARALISQRIANDGRLENARENYYKKLLPSLKYKAGAITGKDLQVFTDSLVFGGNVNALVARNPAVMSLGSTPYYLADWVAFVRVQQNAGKFRPGMPVDRIYDHFLLSKAMDYLPAHLDEVDPVFAEQFKEFKDANLLFDAMERNVWNKAMSDTAGLKKYYEGNVAKYVWDEHVTGINVLAADSLSAYEAFNALKNDRTLWKQLNEQYDGKVFADSGRFELDYFPQEIRSSLKPGECSIPFKNNMDGNFTFVCVTGLGQAGTLRTFDEARGFVVNDYQQVLEQKWIEALKKKYPVKMNLSEWQKVLNSAK